MNSLFASALDVILELTDSFNRALGSAGGQRLMSALNILLAAGRASESSSDDELIQEEWIRIGDEPRFVQQDSYNQNFQ